MTLPNKHQARSAEIRALIALIDDPDPYVQQKVMDRFNELGETVIPLLDEARIAEKNPANKAKIQQLVMNMSTSHVELEMAERINSGILNLVDLENAMFSLSKYVDPLLDVQPYRTYLDNLAASAFDQIQHESNPRYKVDYFLNYMFNEAGFHGKLQAYHAPSNSYLHHTLEQKTGLPLTLAMVLLFVARRVQLSLHGMNMPIHFMLLYRLERETLFIDPFGEGQLATYDQCYYFLKQNGITPRADHFRPAPPKEMFLRTLRNLLFSYQKYGETEKVEQFQALLSMLELDPTKVL